MGVFQQMMKKLHEYGLWRMIAWGEAGVAILDGATFFVKGNAVAKGPSYYLLRHAPEGLHSYGVVMLILASLILYSSATRGRLARRIQFLTFVCSVWISAAIIVSWVQVQQVSFGAVTKWFLMAWVAVSLFLTEDKERRLRAEAEEE